MKIGLITYSNVDYKEMADITNENKKRYCLKRGYGLRTCEAPETLEQVPYRELGFDKIKYVRYCLHSFDWVWFTDVDMLITNFNERLEARIDDYFDFMIATWMNGINAGSFLVKNSVAGRAILDEILLKRGHYEEEQTAISDIVDSGKFKESIQIIAQREINAGDYNLYKFPSNIDKLGTCGQWEPGDLAIHWPGIEQQRRMELLREYLSKVIE